MEPRRASGPSRAPASGRLRTLVLAAAAVLLLARLGATGLWAPDEPRYGQIAEELRSLRHGAAGLVLMHLDGEPYTQKPPLYFWLAAAAGAPFGHVGETAARLPSALAGIALVALTMAFGARLVGGASGVLAGALLLTTFEFAENARRMQLDVLLALFETLALAAFWRLDRGLGRRTPNLVAFHAALGLAVLTKGPVGFLVPLAIAATYLAWDGRLRTLARAFPPWSPLLSIAPALAWIAGSVALAPAGFFDAAVVDNLFGRFFGGSAHARPFWYYAWVFPVRFLPWFLAAPLVVAAARRLLGAGAPDEERRAWRFLLAWLGTTLVFFSLSAGKRGLYVLPAYPAAALLAADALVRWIERERRLPPGFHAVAGGLGAALAAAAVWLAVSDPLGAPLASFGTAAGILLAVGASAIAAVSLARAGAPLALRLAVPIAGVWAVLLVLFTLTWPARDAEKSPRAVAEAAAALTPPGAAIGLVGDRALLGGLAYYGGRRVEVLGDARHIERFVARGGRALVVQERKLERVERAVPVEVRFRARSGRRALVVVTPRAVPGVSPAASPDPVG